LRFAQLALPTSFRLTRSDFFRAQNRGRSSRCSSGRLRGSFLRLGLDLLLNLFLFGLLNLRLFGFGLDFLGLRRLNRPLNFLLNRSRSDYRLYYCRRNFGHHRSRLRLRHWLRGRLHCRRFRNQHFLRAHHGALLTSLDTHSAATGGADLAGFLARHGHGLRTNTAMRPLQIRTQLDLVLLGNRVFRRLLAHTGSVQLLEQALNRHASFTGQLFNFRQ